MGASLGVQVRARRQSKCISLRNAAVWIAPATQACTIDGVRQEL